MSIIDITKEKDATDTIIFAHNHDETEFVKHIGNGDLQITDSAQGGYIEVYKKDITNLIKALQKAQELWGKK